MPIIHKHNCMSLLTSKVAWTFVAIFIIGGLEQTHVIPIGLGDSLLALLGIGGLVAHNRQIKTGKVS